MKYAAENHHSSAILVRSPDSDIFPFFFTMQLKSMQPLSLTHGMAIKDAYLIYQHYLRHMDKSIVKHFRPFMLLATATQRVPLCTMVRLNQSRHWRNSHAFSKENLARTGSWINAPWLTWNILYVHCMGMPNTMMLTNCAMTCS